MSVISIKRLLGEELQTASHPLRISQILLRGMGVHAVEGDPDRFRAFRAAMEESADSLGQAVTDAAALVLVSAALRSLEEHNRGAEDYLHAGGNDLRGMVKMLTAAIGEFSSAGDQNVKNLRQIENRVASASQSQDIRAIKSHLSTCLQEIRKESERQKAAVASTVLRLQQDVEHARTGAIDPTTGLPPRSKAVECIGRICAARAPAFAACMVIDQMQSVNVTFGSDVGDQVLRYFAGYIRRSLPEKDEVFRWAGACLVAILPRESDAAGVKKEMARILEQRIEYSVETPSRNALLPIKPRWALIPFPELRQELIAQIDGFASKAAPS
jgi:diguanylate cyclase (GGDEF)-like protein